MSTVKINGTDYAFTDFELQIANRSSTGIVGIAFLEELDPKAAAKERERKRWAKVRRGRDPWVSPFARYAGIK